MNFWKANVGRKERALWCVLFFVLLAFSLWQEAQIADLQERMMNVEASRYDEQLMNIQWEAETALGENRELQKDVYSLQKQMADMRFRVTELEWDWYGKSQKHW